MADNTVLSSGTGGDTLRDIDKGGIKTQVVVLDIGGSGAESLLTGILPVSAASLPLPAGAALEAGNLATLVARQPVLGSAAAASSSPVVIASDQVLPLPAGAATEATLLAIRDATLADLRLQVQFLAFQSMMSGGFIPLEV